MVQTIYRVTLGFTAVERYPKGPMTRISKPVSAFNSQDLLHLCLRLLGIHHYHGSAQGTSVLRTSRVNVTSHWYRLNDNLTS